MPAPVTPENPGVTSRAGRSSRVERRQPLRKGKILPTVESVLKKRKRKGEKVAENGNDRSTGVSIPGGIVEEAGMHESPVPTMKANPHVSCASIPADRPRRTNEFHKAKGTLEQDGFVELGRAAFLSAAYLQQKERLHLLRKKLKAERKLKRRERREKEMEELQILLNEKQLLIDKMQLKLIKTKERLARWKKTRSAANEPSLQANPVSLTKSKERRKKKSRLPNPRQQSTIPPHEFYGADEPPSNSPSSRDEGRHIQRQSRGPQATLNGDEVGAQRHKSMPASRRKADYRIVEKISNFAVVIPQLPRPPETTTNDPEVHSPSGETAAPESSSITQLSTADLRRQRVRGYKAARRLRQPELSQDVPLAERKTDGALVQVGKLPSLYARHQEAPYAFARSGKIRLSYRRLLEIKNAAGHSVWTERELRSICGIPKGVRLDVSYGVAGP